MPYRFAIVGCGHIGLRHAAQARRTGILAAVADCLTERAQAIAGQFDTKAYSSLTAMLQAERPDIVCICTPNYLHAPQTMESLEAGCHVLCEKPMSISSTDALRMIETARQYGKRLFVVKQNRYNPPVQLLYRLMKENRLGRILSFQVNAFWNRPDAYFAGTWRGKKDLDGGTLYTQFSHFIDLLYWLLGEVEEVSGWRANRLHRDSIEFEDCGVVDLLMRNGARGCIQYTINCYDRNLEGSITLFGEKGTVKIGGQYLNTLEHFAVEGMEQPQLAAGGPPNRYGYYEGSMSNHDKVYDDLIRELDNPQQRMVDAPEALQTIKIIEKIYNACPLSSSIFPDPDS